MSMVLGAVGTIAVAGVAGAAWWKAQDVGVSPVSDRRASPVAVAIRELTPYQLMKAVQAVGGRPFLHGWARLLEAEVLADAPPGSTLNYDSNAATLEDLGVAMRISEPFRMRWPDPRVGMVAMDGEVRLYMHDSGAVFAQTVCAVALGACSSVPSRFDQVEARVLTALDDTGLDSLMPPDAACEVEAEPGRPDDRYVMCKYANGVFVILARVSEDDAKDDLQSTAPEAQFEAWMQDYLSKAR